MLAAFMAILCALSVLFYTQFIYALCREYRHALAREVVRLENLPKEHQLPAENAVDQIVPRAA